MASSRVAWGIDVGNRGLKAIRLSRDGDNLRVDDFDVIEHETPLSQSGDNRESLIARSLTEFVGRHKTGSVPVGIAVSGQQSFARFIKLPPVEEKKIPEIVKFEALQQIPFPLDDVEWAYQLFRKQDDPDVEVGIFAMRKELVNRHVAAYTDVNLNVQVVQMSPLAVYNGLAYDGRLADGTTLIVDMGADTTDLVVADGETVWHRSVPIGGNNFTETLQRAFKLDFAKAEAMKREASTSKYARQIFQAMRPVFADLVAEIQRSVGFYSSTHRDSKLKKAIALGGTFKLPGLQKYLQQNLQLDVERIEAFGANAPSDPRLLAAYQDNVLSAATAYGLAVQALGEGKIGSSLLPSHIRHEQVWRDKAKWFAASAALFVVGAGVALAGAYLPNIAYENASPDRQRIESVMGQASALDTEWSTVEGAGETERNIIKNVRSLATDRTLWPQIVSMLKAALPSETWTDPKAIKATKRGDRRQIFIDEWSSVYLADVGPLLADHRRGRFATEPPIASVAPGAEGGGGGGQIGLFLPTGPQRGGNRPGILSAPGSGSFGELSVGEVPATVITASNGKHGYLLRITGVTPNAEPARLLDETFLSNLIATRTGHAGTPRDFYVADAFLVKYLPVRQNPARLSVLQKSYQELQKFKAGETVAGGGGPIGGGANFNPGMEGEPRGMIPGAEFRGQTFPGAAPSGGPAEDPTPYLDPVTGEDMRDDHEFLVLAFVVIGTPPVPPAAPEGATPAEPGHTPPPPANSAP